MLTYSEKKNKPDFWYNSIQLLCKERNDKILVRVNHSNKIFLVFWTILEQKKNHIPFQSFLTRTLLGAKVFFPLSHYVLTFVSEKRPVQGLPSIIFPKEKIDYLLVM